jgi:uncharacterized phage protein (TIGR01671 family)
MQNLDRFKFRAWHKNKHGVGTMYYLFEDGLDKFYSNYYNNVKNGDWLLEETETMQSIDFLLEQHKDIILMQSTGLRDKNGKLIFEGDIVQASTYKDVVEYKDCAFCLKNSIYSCMFQEYGIENYKIIGNIYENI